MTNHTGLQQAVQYLAARCDGAFKHDGQGFNSADADFGRSLAGRPFWSPKQARAAWKMLRKYRGQLKIGGIDFDAIPEPPNGDDFLLPHESAYEFVLTFGKHNGKSLGELAENSETRSYVEWLATKSYTPEVKFAAQDTIAGKPIAVGAPKPIQVAVTGKVDITAALVGKKIAVKFAWGCRNFHEAKDAVKTVPGRKYDGDNKVWTVPLAQAGALMEAMKGFDNFKASGEIEAAVAAQEEERDALRVASKAESSEFQVKGLGGTLYPFQRAGVEYAVKAKRVIIGDEMGLGKSLEALATIQHEDAFPAIIVCPASLKLNWAREVRKWLPGKTIAIWSGRNGNKEADLADVIIINYDIIHDPKKGRGDSKAPVLRDDLKALSLKAIILDEIHYCKGYKSRRTRAVKELSRKAKIRLGLTGTPILNRPQELLSPLAILGRLGDLGGFWYVAKRYCAAYRGKWGWIMDGADNLEEFHDKMSSTCYIRRLKADVHKELPAKTRAIVPMEIDNRREYESARADVIGWVGQRAANNAEFNRSIAHLSKDERKKARNERRDQAEYRAEQAEHLVRIEALKQVAVRGKMGAVKQWITDFLETGEKLVVFAHHREIVQELAREFDAEIIIGGQSAADRDAAVQKFQTDPNCKVVVSSIQAGGVGLTLTAASNTLTIELGWNMAAMEQAEARIHRIGQEFPCTAWWLIAYDTIEEDISILLDQKAQVVDAVIDGVSSQQSFSILGELTKALMR